jgi:hypothetical protein
LLVFSFQFSGKREIEGLGIRGWGLVKRKRSAE